MTLAFGIAGQEVVDEVVDRLRLRGALHLAGVERRLVRADSAPLPPFEVKWLLTIVTSLPLNSKVATSGGRELKNGLSGLVCWSALPAGSRRSRRRSRRSVRSESVDEVDPVGAIEKGGADVAAGLAAVGVVADERIVDERVLDAGGRRGVDRVDQHLQRQVGGRDAAELPGAVVVLDLLQRDDVGRLEAG